MPRIIARDESRFSPFVRLVQQSVDFEDGKPPQIYHFLAQAPYVQVLARTPSGRIPVVRQFRPCLEVNTLEFPGGTVDVGQDPATAARMEVEEETGHRVVMDAGARGGASIWNFFGRQPGVRAMSPAHQPKTTRAS